MQTEKEIMIKKQVISIAVAAAFAALLAVLWFAVFSPMIKDASAVEDDTPETLPGEEIGSKDRFYMYSHLDRADMASIEIANESGSYVIEQNGDGVFRVSGYEGVALDDTMIAKLVATCGSPLSKTRVAASASDEKLSEYGLKDPRASWTVTDKAGKKYKVYVGRELLTGGGYYCAFAGRDSVYVLDTSLADTVLKPVEAFVTPYVIFGVSKDDYYTIDDFTVYRGHDKFISVGKVDPKYQNNPDALVENVLTYPAPYTPDSEVYLRIIMGFVSFTADETYRLGATEADLAECGLDDPDYTVSFVYKGVKYYFIVSDAGDGNYYVASGIYGDIITKISKRNIQYLEYDLIKWISPYVFMRNITTVSTLTVESAAVNETFHLNHSTAENGKAVLQVATDSGRTFRTDSETLNFRHYYSDVIALALVDYLPDEASAGVPMSDFLADKNNLTMKITCTTTGGDVYEFEIYRYSTRRCAICVNGRFDFCIQNDVVSRIESDTGKLLAGETVRGSN